LDERRRGDPKEIIAWRGPRRTMSTAENAPGVWGREKKNFDKKREIGKGAISVKKLSKRQGNHLGESLREKGGGSSVFGKV